MRRVIGASVGALTIAGSLCGVPYVGAAAIIVNDIVQTCDEVKAQKVRFSSFQHRLISLCSEKVKTTFKPMYTTSELAK
jgi:hypothetical protein